MGTHPSRRCAKSASFFRRLRIPMRVVKLDACTSRWLSISACSFAGSAPANSKERGFSAVGSSFTASQPVSGSTSSRSFCTALMASRASIGLISFAFCANCWCVPGKLPSAAKRSFSFLDRITASWLSLGIMASSSSFSSSVHPPRIFVDTGHGVVGRGENGAQGSIQNPFISLR